jgi:hypothetical protein
MRIVVMGSAITSDDQNPKTPPDFEGARTELTEQAVANIIDDNERVRAAFKSPRGLTRISGTEERHVAYTSVMVVTDRRILFIADPAASGDLGGSGQSLAYADLGAVSVVGDGRDMLALSTARGVRWEFPLPDADPGTVDAVVRHLRWVGELRSRLVACKNDVELAAGEIREHAAEMNWDEAEDAYADVRSQVDQIIVAVQWTEPIEDAVIAPELTDMERTLERAYAQLFIERASSQLELGTQLVENEDYDQARKVLRAAQKYYERAEARADAVRRGDAFQFGEQRELRDRLDRLSWEIEAVAAEPVRQAHEARIQAENANDPAVAVDHWENAFRRYGNVLSLEWGDDDRYFSGDRTEIQSEMVAAGDRLIECHRELARDRWDQGIQAEQEGQIKDALRACGDAVDHLDRAEELATEFRPDDVADIAQRRERMERALQGMRETAIPDEESDGRSEADQADEGTESPEEAETTPGSELLDIDTHQEITLDMNIQEQSADGGVHELREEVRETDETEDEPAETVVESEAGNAE